MCFTYIIYIPYVLYIHYLIIRTTMDKVDMDEKTYKWRDFPGGAVVKNPPANARDTGSIPGPGRSHMP